MSTGVFIKEKVINEEEYSYIASQLIKKMIKVYYLFDKQSIQFHYI